MDEINNLITIWNSELKLTDKHDPNYHSPFDGFRGVVTLEVSASLMTLIDEKRYDCKKYKNNEPKYSKTPDIYVFKFKDPRILKTGDLFANGSVTPMGECDGLAIVSGSKQGWHPYALDLKEFEMRVKAREYTFVKKLH